MEVNMYEDFLFYDIEVFKYNSMVVFKNYEGETVKVFSSSLDGLGELMDKGIITEEGYSKLNDFIRDKTLVGYNNYFYDDFILYAMSKRKLNGFIKEWNDNIIQYKNNKNLMRVNNCKTLDAFQQIDISNPSLKKIEGNMGKSIIESSISFDIDRELTPPENYETFKYCEYDVGNTVEVFKMRLNYFETKRQIVKMLPKNKQDKGYKWNTTSIIGQILHSKKRMYPKRYVSDEMMELVPAEVADMWKQLDTWKKGDKFKVKSVSVEKHGVVFEFGWGGLHAVPKGFVRVKDVKLKDVTSMYPNILINLNGLSDKTSDYKKILDTSTRLKHEGRKAERAPYKLILNSTYGLLNNDYSAIDNPHMAYSICIYGQIALYVLCERLAAVGARLINVNTDGVGYTIDNDSDESIVEDWEKEFKLSLETDYFKEWIQVAVNDYIAITDDGKIKVKGGDVNKYHDNRYFSNNDTRIISIAIVDYLTKGVPIQETIINNLDNPLLFQYILKAGHTYKGVVYKHDPENVLNTTTNRIFAAKKGVEILKKRQDDGLVKFADAPSEMFLWNDDVSKIENFKDIVDKQWYYDLILKKLKRWQ